jgi:hypothetical protein
MNDFNSLTIAQLAEMLRNGAKIPVTCKKPIEDNECYAEGGMRAVLVQASADGHDISRITLDFEPYDEFNKSFETANYFDKNRNATLTAREHGSYKHREVYYFESNSKASDIFEPIEEAQYQLMSEYLSTATGGQSYVSWLEQQVIQLRGAK